MTNIRRTNIVIDAKKYPHWKKFADENYHGSLSQAIRSAMEDSILRSQNEGNPIALRPILERLDKIEKQNAELLNAVNQIGGQVDDFCSVSKVNRQKLLDSIQGILEEADHALLTEDVKAKLSEFTIDEVRGGSRFSPTISLWSELSHPARAEILRGGCRGDKIGVVGARKIRNRGNRGGPQTRRRVERFFREK